MWYVTDVSEDLAASLRSGDGDRKVLPQHYTTHCKVATYM